MDRCRQYKKRGAGRTKQNKVIDFFFSFDQKKKMFLQLLSLIFKTDMVNSRATASKTKAKKMNAGVTRLSKSKAFVLKQCSTKSRSTVLSLASTHCD